MEDVFIYGEIGPDSWGMTSARQIADTLATIGKKQDVRVRINSPGGSVHDGIAMRRTLLDHKGRVHVRVEGLAASAATLPLFKHPPAELSKIPKPVTGYGFRKNAMLVARLKTSHLTAGRRSG